MAARSTRADVSSRRAISGLALGTLFIAVAYGTAFFTTAGPAGLWAMVGGLVLLSLSTIVLTAPASARGRRVLHVALALSGICVAAGLAAPLVLGTEARADESLVWGLPLRAIWVIMVAGVVPLIVMPIAFAIAWAPTSKDHE